MKSGEHLLVKKRFTTKDQPKATTDKVKCVLIFHVPISQNTSYRVFRSKIYSIISVPITKVTLSTTPSDGNPIEIVTGVKKRFECKTDAGRPSSAIQWYISGTNVTDVAVSQPDICYSDCKGKVVSSSVLLYKGNRIDEGKHIYCTALNIESQSVRSQNKSIVILCKYLILYLVVSITIINFSLLLISHISSPLLKAIELFT